MPRGGWKTEKNRIWIKKEYKTTEMNAFEKTRANKAKWKKKKQN